MDIIQNIDSEVFTLSAIVIGYLLIDDSTPAEQNSLGNWFMMIGQVLCTNSAQQQVLNNNNNKSNGTNNSVVNGYPSNDFNNNDNKQISSNTQQQINRINKVIRAMQQEIDNLSK